MSRSNTRFAAKQYSASCRSWRPDCVHCHRVTLWRVNTSRLRPRPGGDQRQREWIWRRLTGRPAFHPSVLLELYIYGSCRVHLREKLAKLDSEMQRLEAYEALMLASPDQQISLTDPDSRSMATSGRACPACPLKSKCTTGPERRIPRWEHEHLLDAVQQRLDEDPLAMRRRRETVSIRSARSRCAWVRRTS